MKKTDFRRRAGLALLFACLFAGAAFGQKEKDKSKKKQSDVGLNMDKVELLYKDVQVTETRQTSYGMSSRSYTTSWPYARINGGELQEIDKKASVFAPYFRGCPSAKKELGIYAAERKKTMQSFWGGFLIGGAVGMAGLLTSVAVDPDGEKGSGGAIFFTGLGLGFGSMVTGLILARNHSKRAHIALDQSVINYNSKCYKPPVVEEIKPDPTAAPNAEKPAAPAPAGAKPGVTEHYQDTAFVDVIRDAPEKTALWSVNLIPFSMEWPGNHFLSFLVGGEAQWQGPKFGLRAAVKYALVDNLGADSYQGYVDLNYEPRDVAIPDDYQKGLQIDVQGYYTIAKKLKMDKERVFLGSSRSYGRSVEKYTEMDTKTLKTWQLRAGAQNFRSVQQSENGLPLVAVNVSNPDFYPALNYDAAVMMRGMIVSAGIGRRTTGDLKFNLRNTDVRGVKESTSYHEWYVEALYAPKLELGGVDYYLYDFNNGGHFLQKLDVSPTPMQRLGGRIGYRVSTINKRSGWTMDGELGLKPGMKNEFDKGMNFYLQLGVAYGFGGRS